MPLFWSWGGGGLKASSQHSTGTPACAPTCAPSVGARCLPTGRGSQERPVQPCLGASSRPSFGQGAAQGTGVGGAQEGAGGGPGRREEESYLGLPSCANSTLGLHQTGPRGLPGSPPLGHLGQLGGRGAKEETPGKPEVLGLRGGGQPWPVGAKQKQSHSRMRGAISGLPLVSPSLPRPAP